MQAEQGGQDSSRVKRLEPSEDVVGQQLGEEVVLVHLKTNRIFELNHTGGRFWNLLQSENERERIEDRLREEYDVSQGDLAAEVDSLISTLASEDLVRILERD
jgi:Coenzyme PQQ synthesis protein D (PqqD)